MAADRLTQRQIIKGCNCGLSDAALSDLPGSDFHFFDKIIY